MVNLYPSWRLYVLGLCLLLMLPGCSGRLNRNVQTPPAQQESLLKDERRGSHFPAQQTIKAPVEEQAQIKQDLRKKPFQFQEKIFQVEKNKDEKDRKGFSVAAIVLSIVGLILVLVGIFTFFMPLGLVGFIMSVLGVVFGSISIKRGIKGLSIASIIIGGIGVLLFLAALIIYLVTLSVSSSAVSVSSGNICGATGCNCAPDCDCNCGCNSPDCKCNC